MSKGVLDRFVKYWYICISCDASIEITSKALHIQDPTCNCGVSNVVWCQTDMTDLT
jgi:predicted RNA-binding Zn-ribbon protein involved in translation (DUF1610 family)